MAFTSNELELVINPALNRIAAKEVEISNQTGQEYNLCNRHYAKARDWLLRSFEWSFAQKRITLYPVQTLTLDRAPFPDAFAVGDVISGLNSGASGTVLETTTDVAYEISGDDMDFDTGEAITNATVSAMTYKGAAVTRNDPSSGDDEAMVWYDTSTADVVVCGSAYPTQADSAPGHEWDYQYDLPSDFIRLVHIFEDSGLSGPEYRYAIEGGRILTNFDTMNVRYVRQVTDPTEFTDLFTEVLVLRLAMILSNPLKGLSEAARQDLQMEWKEAVLHARVVDAQENNTTGNDYLLGQYASPST